MAIISLVARIPWLMTGVPGPVSSNTYTFDTGATAPTEANTAALADDIIALLGTELDGVWSPILGPEIQVSAYDLSTAVPRLAYGYWTGALTTEANGLPGEVTYKVGISAPREIGVPSQRHRGTLHHGPLATSVLTAPGWMSDATVDIFEAAYTDFVTAIGLQAFTWVIGSTVAGYEPITKVTVTNEAGTLRSRQLATTDRRFVAV